MARPPSLRKSFWSRKTAARLSLSPIPAASASAPSTPMPFPEADSSTRPVLTLSISPKAVAPRSPIPFQLTFSTWMPTLPARPSARALHPLPLMQFHPRWISLSPTFCWTMPPMATPAFSARRLLLMSSSCMVVLLLRTSQSATASRSRSLLLLRLRCRISEAFGASSFAIALQPSWPILFRDRSSSVMLLFPEMASTSFTAASGPRWLSPRRSVLTVRFTLRAEARAQSPL
mmetsp:Transcript_31015/g.73729  ORF Transcript_31015/g.73729 Transcript_31015/m.73729 type:complete len:232 (+) Transcript_31015:259-954(+)